ncbi:glutamate mutase L [bacterium]|nr:glutamate mutase L [candidate division CSSED10-310 bacterium]
MTQKPEDIKVIIATDCGSTTTKAILIQYDEEKGEYRQTYRGEAPTTVESPFEDVTKGVLNSISELSELSGRELLDENNMILKKSSPSEGADIYISTSSAGGGLQMMVAGVVRSMTAESAERAALGAGAIVMDVIASNDHRLPHEQIERIRQLRPDMILLSGGIDGGTKSHVVDLAELISAADPKPRLGIGFKLPVIYAGNRDAREEVSGTLEEKVDLVIVDNLRPVLEKENLGPARDKIHDMFMEHVMQQAPGYKKLMEWTDSPIMPTPGAVGAIIERVAQLYDLQVVGVDIGGATTDVFSVFVDPEDEKPVFNRTVSANLGMSYSISNILAEATLPNISRWVPFPIDERELRNQIKNKMIRPTTIPQTLHSLAVEQAIAREALRLAFVQHKSFATTLKGVQKQRTIADAFVQTGTEGTIVNMMNLDLLVGSGGVLSHAPRRNQSAMMMIDAFRPEGITRLAVDSIFMMPHLGVLSEVHPKAATEVFLKDCLVYIGTCIAPVGQIKESKDVMKYSIDLPQGRQEGMLRQGEMLLFPLGVGEKASAVFEPTGKADVGAGKGTRVETVVHGGVVGLILDGRGRPLMTVPDDKDARIQQMLSWLENLKVYNMDELKALGRA